MRAFSRRKLVNPVEVARDGEEALAWIPRWESGETLPLVVLLGPFGLSIRVVAGRRQAGWRGALVEELLEKITDYKIGMAKNFIKMDFKAGHVGDDLGTQGAGDHDGG